ncbi:MAG: endopeptidase La [Armatimonadota bacterium]|nr:endopeptidase La [Armatimonadota bacterium]MCX7778302.1 endopeptidase La [Armatimonadota bacterium]MDW8026310.1 endopeptidase La [Armatimonadota bacterium]
MPAEDEVRVHETHREELPKELPTVALRQFVIYPFMVAPIDVGREKSIRAVDAVAASHRHFITVMQKDPTIDDPQTGDLYTVGTLVMILRMNRLPTGTVQLIVRGVSRVRIDEWIQSEPFFIARYTPVDETVEKTIEVQALMNTALNLFQRVVQLSPQLPDELYMLAQSSEMPSWVADIIASALNLKPQQRQEFLEILNPIERLQRLIPMLNHEIEVLELTARIQEEARKELDKAQREFVLRQQLKEIRKMLGEEDREAEIEDLRRRIEEAGMPEEARQAAERELERLAKMPPAAAEYTVSRTYLDWLISLPWSKMTEDNLDIERAEQILNEDHYDLEDVKERLLEYLAVRKLKPDTKGPILCFVGPPGVGKTSLGQSIARALGRKFVRISLGGVRDEAEIRGHRRTYVGALPGRIIQGIRNAGTKNPVFMLDEVDKLGVDFRGDPAAALLEVLDPEQNHSFVDHYLDVPFDLSQVMFICTANIVDTIPPALLDRMEVIRIPGYTEEEKFEIAKRYLIPRNLHEHGLQEDKLTFSEDAIRLIIRQYTREAGLRNLSREIARICRKVARRFAQGEDVPVHVTPKDLPSLLGPPRYIGDERELEDRIGVAVGLAWTPSGGQTLLIETTKMPGRKEVIITGQLGDVMKESAHAALSYVRSRSSELGIPDDLFEKHDIHIHVPAGAVPKDGPSAGVTIAVALASLATGVPVRGDVAMTGEITLTGRVLPVGGIKEKVLAARIAGIREIILPAENEKDLMEIPEHIRRDMQFRLVRHMDEVLRIALRNAVNAKQEGEVEGK